MSHEARHERLVQELHAADVPAVTDRHGNFVIGPNDLARLINHHACSDNRWEFIPFVNDSGKWAT